MHKSKVVVTLIILTSVLFFVFQFLKNEYFFRYLWALIVPLFTLLYFVSVERKDKFFSLFLLCYAISDLMVFVQSYMSLFMFYYISNSLYILAYAFLILDICKSMSFIHLLTHYKLYFLVLVGLNIYILYILESIVDPYLSDSEHYALEYFLESLYNVTMLVLLSIALINYFYRDNKKALFLFIGSLSMVFSEVINIAYLYVTETKILNAISSIFALLAFIFYYHQSKMVNEKALGIVTR